MTPLLRARMEFASSPLGAVVVPSALDLDTCRDARAAAEGRGYAAFDLAHRGRYEHTGGPGEALTTQLLGIAHEVTGLSFRPLGSRVVRLRRGDYALPADDAKLRPSRDGAVYELIADFSEQSSDEAQVVWSRSRAAVFVAPQASGTITLVRRDESIERHARYLNLRVADRVVVRAQLWLGQISDAPSSVDDGAS